MVLMKRPLARDLAVVLLLNPICLSFIMVLFRCHDLMKPGVMEMEDYSKGKGECKNSNMAFAVSCGIAVLFVLRREWEYRNE